MDADTISKIANAIAWHFQSTAYAMLAIQAVLVFLAAAGGAYFGAYLKEKGKNLATKHDFEDLKEQLKANTELVEKVKSEISRGDWMSREWTNLRRLKLEELLLKMSEAEHLLQFLQTEAFYERGLYDRTDPIGVLESIGRLYFPELTNETTEIVKLHYETRMACGNLVRDLLLDKQKPILEKRRREIVAKFQEDDLVQSNKLAQARQRLKTAARSLMVEIMGVK
jgi:hypothetical protein